MTQDIEKLINLMEDPQFTKIDIMNHIYYMSRKEKNDHTYGLIIRAGVLCLKERDLI